MIAQSVSCCTSRAGRQEPPGASQRLVYLAVFDIGRTRRNGSIATQYFSDLKRLAFGSVRCTDDQSAQSTPLRAGTVWADQ